MMNIQISVCTWRFLPDSHSLWMNYYVFPVLNQRIKLIEGKQTITLIQL